MAADPAASATPAEPEPAAAAETPPAGAPAAAGGAGAAGEAEEPKPMSKKARKRAERRAKWLERRPAMRAAERERRKRRRAEKRAEAERLRAEGKEVPAELLLRQGGPRRNHEALQRLVAQSTLHLAIDVDFDKFHQSDKDMTSLLSQVRNSYGTTRRAAKPARLSVLGASDWFHSRLKAQQPGYERWVIDFDKRPYHEVYPADRLVYLSADAEEEVSEFDPEKVYVIGGIVDHNAHKGLTQRLAVERGVPTARLPIGKYLAGSARKVLTVNHVVDLLQEVHDTGDWGASLEKVLPRRKGLTRIGAPPAAKAEAEAEAKPEAEAKADEPMAEGTKADEEPKAGDDDGGDDDAPAAKRQRPNEAKVE